MLQDQTQSTERIRQIKAELRRQRNPKVQRQFAEERRAAIAAFEMRYGIPSDQIHQAIEGAPGGNLRGQPVAASLGDRTACPAQSPDNTVTRTGGIASTTT
ncbi:hypothetical protein OO015_13925 [Thermomicrobium sp. 4228-Ro]|uniref:hypothetical protein n=1 Tax=Thermomicrobium sp. 4228-Ro TaxID=2993937 RepID=UPI00224969E0|nr:hypothetical protein [Thermomicrobium sp. 4228-Ro]MCX2728584.1 hypothetical protein [Thermomicrobium sp. 4228-Ro]